MFKAGDKVCYKDFPDIYIGSISPIEPFSFGDEIMYHVYTSDDWFMHFAPYGGPNTLTVNEDSIMLFDENKTMTYFTY